MNGRIRQLEDRLSDVIKDYCNDIGCRECPLKWDGSCSADELQDEIYEEEKNIKLMNKN